MAPVRRAKTTADVPTSKELEKVLAGIRKAHGQRTVSKGVDIFQPWRIRTNIFLLDYALLGGIPHNRFTMVHGKKHSGKTTLLMKAIAGAQQSLPDQEAVVVDIEGTYDKTWGLKNGVDNERLTVVTPDTGEQAVDMTIALIHARETSLIAIDSVAAMLPMKEEAGSAEDESIPGLQAKLITRLLRRANVAIMEERKRDHYVSVIFVNQQRAKIGGWSPAGADATSLPGGQALGFFTSVEIQMKNKENVKADGTGQDTLKDNEHSFVIQKNKHNAGLRSGEFRMLRRDDPELGLVEGQIDEAGTMLAFAKRVGWYEGTPKGGYTLEFGDISERYSDGDEAVAALYQSQELFESLRTQLIVNNAISQKMPEEFISYLLGN